MKLNAINWPQGFVPGFTAEDIWPLLATPSLWPT